VYKLKKHCVSSFSRRKFVKGAPGAAIVLSGASCASPPPTATKTVTWFPSPTVGTTLYIYQGHLDAVFALAWSPDGKRIASGSEDKRVQIWKGA
jgi:WD40 repeat protein